MSKYKRTPEDDAKNIDAIMKEAAKQPTLASRILSQTPTSFTVDTGIDPPPRPISDPLQVIAEQYLGPPPEPEVIAELEQKLAAMVDARLASLERRVDLLYRYTVGDRAGGRYLVPNMHQRGEEFPEAEHE